MRPHRRGVLQRERARRHVRVRGLRAQCCRVSSGDEFVRIGYRKDENSADSQIGESGCSLGIGPTSRAGCRRA